MSLLDRRSAAKRHTADAGPRVGHGAHPARAHPIDKGLHQLLIHPADELAVIFREGIERAVRETNLIGDLLTRLEAISRQGPLRGTQEAFAIGPRSGSATRLLP